MQTITSEAAAMTRRPILYPVTFTHAETGRVEVSRICQSLRVARKWARWVSAAAYAQDVAIWRGAVGGQRVKAEG